jgi:hypothetical protein
MSQRDWTLYGRCSCSALGNQVPRSELPASPQSPKHPACVGSSLPPEKEDEGRRVPSRVTPYGPSFPRHRIWPVHLRPDHSCQCRCQYYPMDSLPSFKCIPVVFCVLCMTLGLIASTRALALMWNASSLLSCTSYVRDSRLAEPEVPKRFPYLGFFNAAYAASLVLLTLVNIDLSACGFSLPPMLCLGSCLGTNSSAPF